MPEQHRAFLAQQPYLFVGAIDADGSPLATLLCGPPGFVQSPDAATLHIAALPDAGDPAQEALSPGSRHRRLGNRFLDSTPQPAQRPHHRPRCRRHQRGRRSKFRELPAIHPTAHRRLAGAAARGRFAPGGIHGSFGWPRARGHRGSRHVFCRQPLPARKRRGVRRGYFASRRPPGLHSRRRRRVDHSRLPRQPLFQHAWQSASPSRARPCCSSILRAAACCNCRAWPKWIGAARRCRVLRAPSGCGVFMCCAAGGAARRAPALVVCRLLSHDAGDRGLAYRYRAMSLSSAARPGESFSKGMLFRGASAVRFKL